MSQNRNYNYSDVDAMLASQIIAGSFSTYLPELSNLRTNWTPEYAGNLATRIEETIQNYLGIDTRKGLRDASASLLTVIAPAKRDLSFFKTQIDEDFKNETAKRKEILKTLGFTKSLRAVQKNNQGALIELLYAFRLNMTNELREGITAKAMAPVLIDNICGYADTVKTANVAQESLKETTKDITKEAVEAFNATYNEIILICKIASNFYQYEPIKKEQFTFSKVVANMKAIRKTSPEQ